MKKPPAIVYNTIDTPRGCFAVKMMPHKEAPEDIRDEWDQAYADAMELIVDGKLDEGIELLVKLNYRKYYRAGHTLAYGYSAGWFGEPDNERYLAMVHDLVLKGHPAAMSDYGFCYDHGIGVKKSRRWALYWYKKAADRGVTAAMNNLANIYLFSEKKYRNIQLGLLYAFMAADYDDEQAQNHLGLCYEYGIGVQKDYEKAYQYFSLAVKNGAGACAEHNLARCFRKGLGIEKNLKLAEKYERLAQRHGFYIKKENHSPVAD